MQLEISGKVALVTGSSRGIGQEIAQVLYNEGCHVMLNGRNANALETATSKLPNAKMVVGDVTQAKDARNVVLQTLKEFGRLDILVCNVGGGRSVPPGKETLEEWQRVFALNLWSTTNTVEASIEALEASQGVIICISSICGVEVVSDAPVTYSAAKAALHAYVRGIARPLGKKGVRINAVASGNILFAGSVWEDKINKDSNKVQQILESNVSLSRLGSSREVAELVAFLASSRSSFTTGSIWTVDGGQVHS